MAVNDGVVKKIGRSKKLGRYLVLQDVYGNRYTYAHLGEVSKYYPVPKDGRRAGLARTAKAVKANGEDAADPTAAPRLGRAASSTTPTPRPARPRRRHRVAPTHPGLGAGQAAPVRPPGPAGRARGTAVSSSSSRRWRATAASSRPTRTSSRALRPRPEQGAPARPQEGLPRDRRDDPRPHRPDGRRARPPISTSSIRPAGRGAPDRSEADPRRLEAARGHRDLPRLGRNVLYGDERPAACRSARSCCCRSRCSRSASSRRAHRDLRVRPRRHPLRPDRPARARHARLPRRVRAQADRHLAQVRPRLLHELRATSRTTPPATRSTSR